MKKFTKFWRWSMVLLLSISFAYLQGQNSSENPLLLKVTEKNPVVKTAVQAQHQQIEEVQSDNEMIMLQADIAPETTPEASYLGVMKEYLTTSTPQYYAQPDISAFGYQGLAPEILEAKMYELELGGEFNAQSNSKSVPTDAVNIYTFSQSTSTFTPITGGTIQASDPWDDLLITAVPLGFTFNFDGSSYTNITISPNGYVIFGGTSSLGYSPISSSTTAAGCAAAVGRDLEASDAVAGSTITTLLSGTSPNQVFTIEWLDAQRYGTSYDGELLDFQIKLYESSDRIEFVYGPITGSSYVSAINPQVGIRGATNTDYLNRTTTTDWSATTAGAINTATCTLSDLIFPANGLTFIFDPPVNPPPGVVTNPVPTDGATGIATSGNLTWDFGANTDTYDLWFGPVGSMTQVVTGGTAGATGSYSYSGISAATTYEWQVISHNSFYSTDGPVWSFSTVCPVYVAPFTESFDVQADPVCWTNTSSNPVSNGLWEYGNATTNPAGWGATGVDDHTGNGGFFAWTDGSTPEVADITLTTPFIDISSLSVPLLEFYVFSNNEDFPGDNVPLYVDFWDGAAWINVLTYAADNPNWVKQSVDLSAYPVTGDVQLRFITDQTATTNDAFYNDILIDDIALIETPACPDPFGMVVSGITETSADLTWTSNSGLSDVEYGPSGFAQGTGIPLTGVTSPQTITPLTSYTAYDVYYRDDCGSATYSNWVGPVTFQTLPPAPVVNELIFSLDLESICGTNVILASEYFPATGMLWVTGTTSSATQGDEFLYEVNPFTGTLVNTYPQTTVTSVWGYRDLARDNVSLYAGCEDGFYRINPNDGSIVQLFDNTAFPAGLTVIRGLARNPANGHFFAKSFTADLFEFDAAGTFYNQWSFPADNPSTYGAAWNPNTGMLWLHATSIFSTEATEFIEVDPATGLLTGMAYGIPDQPCPVLGIVGGGFMDFGNMFPGRDILGATLQATPDVLHVVEFVDDLYPDQSSNFMPVCDAADLPVDGDLTWDFGAKTTTYDLLLGPIGSMSPVVTGATAGATGSYAYTGLMGSTTYEWQVVEHNTTGTTFGPVLRFSTLCTPVTTYPATEDFETFVSATDATGYLNCWSTSPAATTASYRWNVDAGGTSSTNTGPTVDHTTGTATGIYLHTEASSGAAAAEAYVYSPEYDLTGLPSAQIEFWYHMWGATMGELHLDIDAGAGWVLDIMTPLIGQQTAAQTDPYQNVVVDLNSYIGQTVKFRFRAIRGSSYDGDMAIDDVTVGEQPPCPAPTGLGVANNIDPNIDLVWTTNSGLSNVEWGLSPLTLGTGTPINGVAGGSVTIGPLTTGTAYDFYVQDDCGADQSTWAGPYTFTYYPAPPNDDCTTAISVGTGGYPETVNGTTFGANIDCPGLLDWNAVWYAIDLPNANNYLTVDYCNTLFNVPTVGIVYYFDCSDCNAYVVSDFNEFVDCGTGFTTPYTEFYNIPGPTTIYYPVYLGATPTDFTVTFDVTGPPVVDATPVAYTPTVVENGNANEMLNIGNAGDFILDYQADVVYPGATVTCYPLSVANWTGTTDGTAITDNSEVRGYSTEDGWFMFDISAVPAGATIVNIEFFGYVNSTNWPYWSMTPVTSDPLTTDPATLLADIVAEASTGYYLYQNEPSTYTTGWKQHSLGGNANADLEAALAQGWFAMGMVSRDNSITYFVNWDGWNEANPPYIEVTYATGAVDWCFIDGGTTVSGEVLPGDPADMFNVNFDATGLAPGVYNCDIEVASSDPITPSVLIPVSMTVQQGIAAELTVLLEGPYDVAGAMTTELSTGGYIPLAQPYNPALPYYDNPSPKWLYAGSESVAAVPDGVVDWVLVQVRDAVDAASASSATIEATQAAFLMSDGSVVGLDGMSRLGFPGVTIDNDLFMVIYHRNHLGIMSANALTNPGGFYDYDFSSAETQVFGGANGHKELEVGYWGMISSDGNGNGLVQNTDETAVWKLDLGGSGYQGGDFDMNGLTQNTDETNYWKPNLGGGGQVPAKSSDTGYQSQIPK